MTMTQALANYQRDGFYIAKSLLNREAVIGLSESLAKTFRDQLHFLKIDSEGLSLFELMRLLHQNDILRYRKVVGAIWRKLDVYELMHDSKITGFLKTQFGWQDLFVPGGQVVHVMADELKIPDGYFGLVPHQDFPSVQGSLDGVVVWVPLVNVDKNNYPLEVIPASHMQGILPIIKHENSTWEVKTSQFVEADYVPVEVEVGDVVFMSCFTVHRSSTRGQAGRMRLAMSTRFDHAEEPTYVDRAYPTAYVRTVHREQYVENFPTLEQVRNVFK